MAHLVKSHTNLAIEQIQGRRFTISRLAGSVSDPIHARSLAEISGLIRRRDVSPVEVTEAVIARVTRIDPDLNAFITVTADEALSAARQVESEIAAGRWRGPLHGVPVSVKDLFHMAGVRTTAASRFFATLVSGEDGAQRDGSGDQADGGESEQALRTDHAASASRMPCLS